MDKNRETEIWTKKGEKSVKETKNKEMCASNKTEKQRKVVNKKKSGKEVKKERKKYVEKK